MNKKPKFSKIHSRFIFLVSFLSLFAVLGSLVLIFSEKTNKTISDQYPVEAGINYPISMPVLVLSYLPTIPCYDNPNLQCLDTSITGDIGPDETLDFMKAKINLVNNQTIESMNKGTRYHGYKDIYAKPSLSYYIIDSLLFLKELAPGLEVPWNEGIYRPDYLTILNNLNICNYVDNMGVKEIWMWGYHYGNIEPVESNMSMGRRSQQYWNRISYGDISNSEGTNDLPICNNTYVLYNYNISRDVRESIEDHAHHIEAVMEYMNYDLWGNKFVGRCGSRNFYRCGWTHYPPNVREYCASHDYDWYNQRQVLSDCEDWTPDGSGEKKMVSCNTWSQGADCENSNSFLDANLGFKIWWMQNIPGLNNNLIYRGERLRNWWDFIGDFDNAIAINRDLIYSVDMPRVTPTPTPMLKSTPMPTPTPTPTSSPTPMPTPTPTARSQTTFFGWLDGQFGVQSSNYCYIQGWACDYNQANKPLSIKIVIDGEIITTIASANIYRAGTTSAEYCNDNGLHGFKYYLPSNFHDDKKHKIAVYAVSNGVEWLLPGTEWGIAKSREIQCQP